jgi:hypothetical protein
MNQSGDVPTDTPTPMLNTHKHLNIVTDKEEVAKEKG